MNDEMLMKSISQGDQSAFSCMIRTYSKLLWVVVGGILGGIGTVQDIEECISDVYVHVWQNPTAFDPHKGSLKTFLAVIAKNRALNVYRKLSKANIAELDEAISSADNDLLDYIVDKEMSQELYAAIATLAEPDKEILIRRYFFDQKPAAIAEHTALPVVEVKNRLYQSKLRLRKKLTDAGGAKA